MSERQRTGQGRARRKAGSSAIAATRPTAAATRRQAGRWSLIAGRMLRLTMPQWWVILIIIAAGFRLLVGGAALWIKWKLVGSLPPGAELPPGMTLASLPNPDDSVLGILVDGSGTMLLGFVSRCSPAAAPSPTTRAPAPSSSTSRGR